MEEGARDVHRAWWSLLLFPVSFLGAFAVGEGLASLFGHPSGDSGDVPVWVMAVAGGPALLVFVLPAILAVVSCRRAQRQGNPGGRVPMRIAVGTAALFVLLNVVQGVLVVVLD
ncbi:hypothetical protein ASG94_18205 [Nocardioides sp. Soil805]|nr:hypothetical protein ASG94_18205 [Nocardioides sp. Soil805]